MNLAMMVTGPFQTNCYIVSDGERATVIDPGLGAAPAITQHLKDTGLTLEQVLLTHGHIDHTRDAAAVANQLGCTVYIHPADAGMLKDGSGVSEQARELFDATSMPYPDSLEYLHDAEEITICGANFTVRHAPGHSPGSVLFVGEKVCFSGDVLFAGSIGRTDLPGSDTAAMKNSLATVVAKLKAELHVLPGHGPETTMAAELKSNPFLA
nr:MBL fold metallo-hydrolase [Corynebacterium ciconiae]